MGVAEDIQRSARRLRRQGVFVSPKAQIVRRDLWGDTVFFTVVTPEDEIQKHHLIGEFYEPEELDIIRRYFPIGGRLMDVGANVGNHSLYVAKYLRASRIAPVEPSPAALAILESNIYLNGLEGVVDRRGLGCGLSDQAVENARIRVPATNLGGARIIGGEGDIRLARGDELFAGERFDMIKIDVERLEIAALRGLEELIAETRPVLFVEVDAINADAFDAWLSSVGYASRERFQRYRSSVNHLALPQ